MRVCERGWLVIRLRGSFSEDFCSQCVFLWSFELTYDRIAWSLDRYPLCPPEHIRWRISAGTAMSPDQLSIHKLHKLHIPERLNSKTKDKVWAHTRLTFALEWQSAPRWPPCEPAKRVTRKHMNKNHKKSAKLGPPSPRNQASSWWLAETRQAPTGMQRQPAASPLICNFALKRPGVYWQILQKSWSRVSFLTHFSHLPHCLLCLFFNKDRLSLRILTCTVWYRCSHCVMSASVAPTLWSCRIG